MLLRKIVFSIVAVFLFVLTRAQNKALDAIDKNDLKHHLTIIASDSLMGRQIGAENNGLDMAADYIKNTIEKLGLTPVKGSYFQPVEMAGSKFDPQKTSKQVQAKNVMGMIEGSDPELKNECVVLMAHYDHLGMNKSGDVYNGADDNGSGVVTILEVADAWMHTPQKPKRSVLFLWVTGEEIGMFGSRFYTLHPAFPLEKTVTCINIDMDGRVYEPRDSVWKDSPKKVKDFDGLYTLTDDIWPGLKEINSEKCRELGLVPDYSLPSNFLRSSDHYYFHNNGVPILNLATGYHYDYHKVTDEVSRINFDKMKRVADLCYLVSYEIANMDNIKILRQ